MNRSIYTSATTLFAVIAIFLFGGETIRNFSFAMLCWLSSGFYTSTFLAWSLVDQAAQPRHSQINES